MLVELIVMTFVGVVFLIMGLLIWKKRKISLIHSYHWSRVSEADKGAYTSLVGRGVTLIGAGILLTGVIDCATESGAGWIVFGCAFAAGIFLMIRAGIRWNR